MRGDILYTTKGHIVFEGEEMVQIAHIHEAETTEQALKERNDFCDTLDDAIEKIQQEENTLGYLVKENLSKALLVILRH